MKRGQEGGEYDEEDEKYLMDGNGGSFGIGTDGLRRKEYSGQ